MLHFARWKVILVLLISLGGIIFALPNLFPASTLSKLPDWIPHRQVNLGLDLQGGAHLLYEMDEKELVEDWLKTIRGDVRDVLRKEKIGYRGIAISVKDKAVIVRLRPDADAEKALKELQTLVQPIGGNAFTSVTGIIGNTLEVTKVDDHTIRVAITDAGLAQRISAAIESSIETVRRRIDAFGTTEPTIQRQGRNRILVQVPGIKDVARLKGLVGETGKLEFKLVDPTTTAQQAIQTKRIPPGSEIVPSVDGFADAYLVKARPILTGENLVDAHPAFDQRTNEPIVTFRFDAAGARRFGRVTSQNVGRPFAIILDGKVISAPVIREPILGGT
ncbi:MAG: protein translocase subunit SecD, partial [Alphaproteobacteria bacterium]